MNKEVKRIVTNEDISSFEKLETIARAYEGEDGKRYIRGYAAVYNSDSKMLYDPDIGPFIERIKSGAFDNVINQDTYVCRDHLDFQIFGRTVSGTLRLWSDEIGLGFEVEMPDNVSYANDTYELVKRGDLFGCSFRASIDPEGETRSKREDGATLRTISSFKRLVDVAIVGTPAYPDTSVSARNNEYGELSYEIDTSEERAYTEQLEILEEMQTKIFIIKSILEKDEMDDEDKEELKIVLNDMIEYSQTILESLNLNIERSDETDEESQVPFSIREKELEKIKLKK